MKRLNLVIFILFLGTNLVSGEDYSDKSNFENNKSLQIFIDKVQLENNSQIDNIIKQMKNNNLTQKDILFSLYELNRIQYQNQILKISNDVADVDTHNNVLETKIDSVLNIYEVQLDSLNKQMKITLDSQQKKYETELQSQLNLFNSIIGIATTLILGIGLLIGFYGFPRLREFIKDKVDNEISTNHTKQTKELVNKLAENEEFLTLFKAKFDAVKMQKEISGAKI